MIEIEKYKRWEHTMKEHKYERIVTYLLFIAIVILACGVFFYKEVLCFYILIPVIFASFIFRILAGYHHKVETKLMKKQG